MVVLVLIVIENQIPFIILQELNLVQNSLDLIVLLLDGVFKVVPVLREFSDPLRVLNLIQLANRHQNFHPPNKVDLVLYRLV